MGDITDESRTLKNLIKLFLKKLKIQKYCSNIFVTIYLIYLNNKLIPS
jgi:hypothetical protein